jgi:polar amino acid transport system substrate-binding protein
MKLLRVIASLVAAGALLVSGASAWAEEESRLDVVMKRDKLIVATYSTAPPLSFKDEKGDLVGFEIDLVRIIAAGLLGDSNKVEFLIIDSAGRFPAVLSGKADFGIAATTIYPDRANRVAFTSPYMDSGVSLFARKDLKVNSIDQLNNEKFTIGGKNNPQNAERATQYVPKMKTKWFDTDSALLLAVKSGIATAAQTDTPIAEWFAASNPDLKVLPFTFGSISNNAIFMKPGDFKWWLFLDTVVKELRTGSRYDQYKETYKKWFGTNPPPQRFYTGGRK